MSEPIIQLPWEQPGWLEQASDWIMAQLAQHGLRADDPIELVHQRPWSAFAQLRTDGGMVYFKAPAPMYPYEAPLAQALERWRPDCSVPLLAVDQDRGWLLSSDAGRTLRSLGQTHAQLEHWPHVLALNAELQLQMAERVPDLLALGMPDRRLSGLPQQYDRLLADTDNLLIGQKDGLTHEQYGQLRGLRERFAASCELLASYGLPETLVHEEVHENNVLAGARGYILTDWSDSSVGHPFFSMLVTIRSIAHWLKLEEGGPEILRLRDGYLEPWTTFATRAQLGAAFAIAFRLAMVNRSLSWYHILGPLDPQRKADYADNVPGWLQDFLDAEHMAGA